jgi:hypothetical protein
MPENKLVVIVARTHMYGGRVCVGALSDAGENLRLMNKDCASDRDRDSPFKVGEEWEITCAPCGPRRPPHVEDAFVSNATKRGNVGSLSDYILKRAAPWKGAINTLFEGKIQFTRNGAGFISDAGVLAGATGFWIPAYDLHLDHDDRNKAGYYPQHDHRHLSYVGVQDAVDVITAGQLVRVSLARWWRPENADPDFEEQCYAQLSGWY